MQLRAKKLTETAVIPTKAHTGDLGYDLYSDSHYEIESGDSQVVSTGIAIGFPHGYGGFIKDRSSISTQRGLITGAGVIDNEYIGEIKILIINHSRERQVIEHGEKIAQIVLIPVTDCSILEVEELESHGRGTKGFGSTGMKKLFNGDMGGP